MILSLSVSVHVLLDSDIAHHADVDVDVAVMPRSARRTSSANNLSCLASSLSCLLFTALK
jgi:hypothetical protein